MKTLIVEDSRLARDGLVQMLEEFSDLEIIGTAADAEQARGLIAEHRPELLFVDINLPGESGFSMLESLDYSPRIIFTTAYSEYAIKSFDYHTVDYLLKPISEERLAAALRKLAADPTPATAVEPRFTATSRIFVKDGDHCHLVQVAAIAYIESCRNHARLFFEGKRAFVKRSLNHVEKRLPADIFFRANRQYLINLDAVVAIADAIHGGYEVTMKDGCVIEVSRRNAGRLKERLSL